MAQQHDTPATGWSAPRLIALGTAQASQNGASSDTVENGSYYILAS